MEEVWKSITGYDGIYEVSNLGRIKSLARIRYTRNQWGEIKYKVSSKILKLHCDKQTKTLRVKLSDEKSIKRQFLVSRLVALEFIDNPSDLLQVLHISGDQTDNSVNNLKWVDAREAGTFHNKPIHKIRCVETGEVFEYAKDIQKKYGFDYGLILRCCKSKYKDNKTAYGHNWEYLEAS